jgi:hypothetical protein
VGVVIMLATVVGAALMIVSAVTSGAIRSTAGVEGTYLGQSVTSTIGTGLALLAAGILVSLPFFAFAQMINLLITLAEDTRATLQAVQQQSEALNALASEPHASVPPSVPSRPSSAPLPPREQIGG